MDINAIQDNINDQWKPIEKDIEITVFPLVFFYDYDSVKYYEYSNKCIAPVTFLRKLSHYEDLKYPVHFKLNNSDVIISIYKFVDDIESLYVPNHIYSELNVNTDDFKFTLNIVNDDFPKATELVLKPFRSTFLSIPDIKKYLEIHLKKGYSVLQKDSIIPICYRDASIDFEIKEINSNNDDNVCSLIETDIEVVIDTPYDSDYKCT